MEKAEGAGAARGGSEKEWQVLELSLCIVLKSSKNQHYKNECQVQLLAPPSGATVVTQFQDTVRPPVTELVLIVLICSSFGSR